MSDRVCQLTIHSPKRDSPRLRMSMAKMVNAANLRPAGMPPSAILMIDKIVGKVPNGSGFNSGTDMRSRVNDQARWQSAVSQQMASAYAHAKRPLKGQINESAKSIVFCDQAELIACLCHDIIAGSAQQKWWWQKTYAKNIVANNRSSALAACLLQDPKLIPSVVNLLAQWDLAIALVNSLEDAAAITLLNAVLVEFGCNRLFEKIAHAEAHLQQLNSVKTANRQDQNSIALFQSKSSLSKHLLAQARTDADNIDQHRPVTPSASQISSAPWLSLFGDQIWDPRLSKPQLGLLGIARMAHSNLSLLRNAVFEHQLIHWWRSNDGVIVGLDESSDRQDQIRSSTSADIQSNHAASKFDDSLPRQGISKPTLVKTHSAADNSDFESINRDKDSHRVAKTTNQSSGKTLPENSERLNDPESKNHSRQKFNSPVSSLENGENAPFSEELTNEDQIPSKAKDDYPPTNHKNPSITSTEPINSTRNKENLLRPMDDDQFISDEINHEQEDDNSIDDLGANDYWLADGDAFNAKGVNEGWFDTQLGGALYILNLFYQLELPECFDNTWNLDQHVRPWALLEVLTRALFADCNVEYQNDPYWIYLAKLDHRQKKSVVGKNLKPSTDFYLPVEWWNYLIGRQQSPGLRPTKSTRLYWAIDNGSLRIWSPKCVIVERYLTSAETDQVIKKNQVNDVIKFSLERYRTEAITFDLIQSAFEQAPVESQNTLALGLNRWVGLVIPFLRHYLKDQLKLKSTHAQELVKKLVVFPGRIYFTTTHIDLVASLRQTSLTIRCSGLDQDPGWLPTYGRVVLFHFLQE